MSIGRKIAGGYLVVLLLLVAVVSIGSYNLGRVVSGYRQLIDVREWLARAAAQLEGILQRQVADYRGVLLYPADEQAFVHDLAEDHQEFAALVDGMGGRVTAGEDQRLLEEIVALHARRGEAHERVIALAQAGRREEAIEQSFHEVRPLTRQLSELVARFSGRQVRLQGEAEAALAAHARWLNALRLTAAALAVLFGAGVAFFLSRSITRQLREGISELASCSEEIIAMTSQVAAGSAQTATAVSETSATAEEVKQAALMSLQKSKDVAEMAQKAAQAALAGQHAVEDAIAGARRIQDQMGSIAESIVRLSEQSQAVGEIIATVNDLADQSNVLAVNAAIEAAKAGEQGKGFAVVAQEVRSLAEQSKQATAQVRAILTDIQKAMSSALRATEQGSTAVEAGANQAGNAGEAIQVLAASVSEAARAATQIVAATQQQQAGMEQVALAVGDIHRATTQNVAGTRQAEQAAQRLAELERRLRGLVEGERAAAARMERAGEPRQRRGGGALGGAMER